MSDIPEYVQKFVEFLHDSNWHKHIVGTITHFLEAHHFTMSDIDSLLMTTTKKVEASLRAAVARHQGSPVPGNRSYGIRLLEYAVDCHLIQSKEQPIYALLYWIVKEPRNTSHHVFKSYPYNTLVMVMTQANEALEEIERLMRPTYGAYLRTNYDKTEKKIKIEKVKVLRPNGSPLPSDQKVEVALYFPDRKVKTVPLTIDGDGSLQGEYDARGEACGTISCYLRGVNHGTPFVASTGSSIAVAFPQNEYCPECGTLIISDTAICPSCGKRLRVP